MIADEATAGIRVILVDDHALVRGSIRTLLEGRGVNVVAEAANGREALDALSVGADLVLMDYSMPVMNGIEATAGIRERDPFVEVLAFTIDDSPEIVDAMLAAGASRHFAKNDYRALLDHLAARATAEVSSDAGV